MIQLRREYRAELSTGGRGRHLFWVPRFATGLNMNRQDDDFWLYVYYEMEYGVSLGALRLGRESDMRYMV